MKRATRKAIEARSKKLLEDLRITKPPINLDAIADYLDVPIIREALASDISGFLYTEANRSAIIVNKTQRHHRQRFTIAHELGHLLLSHKRDQIHVDKGYVLNFRSDSVGEGSQSDEVQANAFAAMLLMPTEMLKADLNRLPRPFDDTDIERLAEYYDVSIQAFLIRLNGLGKELTLETN